MVSASARVEHLASTAGHAGHCPNQLRGASIGFIHFFVERMMRFTTETDKPNVRAIVGAFSPAANDARMRFAFPSGISAICAVSGDDDTGRDAEGAEASLVCRNAPFPSGDLRLNRRLQPLKFRAFQIPERGGEIAWQSDRRSRRYLSRCCTQSR